MGYIGFRAYGFKLHKGGKKELHRVQGKKGSKLLKGAFFIGDYKSGF